jgi:exoribonuclease R
VTALDPDDAMSVTIDDERGGVWLHIHVADITSFEALHRRDALLDRAVLQRAAALNMPNCYCNALVVDDY